MRADVHERAEHVGAVEQLAQRLTARCLCEASHVTASVSGALMQLTGAASSAVPVQEAAATTDSHAATAEPSVLPAAAVGKVKASKAQGQDAAKSAARRAQIRERVKKDLARRDAKKKAASRNFNKKFVKGSRKLKFKASDHI